MQDGDVMKIYFWIPFACLAGILIGAWGPREEIREMKRLEEEKREIAKTKGANAFKTFAGLVNIPEEAKRPHRRRKNEKPLFVGATNRATRVSAVTNAVMQAEADPATNAPTKVAGAPAKVNLGDLRARLEEAQDLWRARVEIARANWKSKLKIASEDDARFNAALDEMNDQLYESMRALSQLVSEKGKMTAELGLRLVADATTIMAETYEKVGACAAPELRDDVANMPMTDFIDPGVAEPLVDVQGLLEHFPGGEK